MQRFLQKNHIVAITVPADVLAPLGARTSADAVMTRIAAFAQLYVIVDSLPVHELKENYIAQSQDTKTHKLRFVLG